MVSVPGLACSRSPACDQLITASKIKRGAFWHGGHAIYSEHHLRHYDAMELLWTTAYIVFWGFHLTKSRLLLHELNWREDGRSWWIYKPTFLILNWSHLMFKQMTILQFIVIIMSCFFNMWFWYIYFVIEFCGSCVCLKEHDVPRLYQTLVVKYFILMGGGWLCCLKFSNKSKLLLFIVRTTIHKELLTDRNKQLNILYWMSTWKLFVNYNGYELGWISKCQHIKVAYVAVSCE